MEQTDFMSASQKIKRLYRHKFKQLNRQEGLTQIEVDILLFLANNPAYDTAKDIVELRGLSKSQVSQGIERLIARGYLATKVDDADRRYEHLEICPAAKPVCRRAQRVQREFLEALLDGIPDEDRAALRKTLDRVIQNAEKGIHHVD